MTGKTDKTETGFCRIDGGGSPEHLVTLATTKGMLPSRLFEKARHRPRMRLIELNLPL